MIKRNISKFLKSKMLFDLLLKQNSKSKNPVYFVLIDPNKISHISVIPEDSPYISGPNAVYGSYSGVFDFFTTPFKRHFMYNTVEQMLNGKDWESTPYFKKLLKLKSKQKAIKHLEKLNDIVSIFTNKGYLSQYQLGNLDRTSKIGLWEVPLHETIIGMDRNGNFFRLKGGRHRLAVAQNINIREIPAILTLYHENAKDMLPEKKRVITGSPEDFRPFKKP